MPGNCRSKDRLRARCRSHVSDSRVETLRITANKIVWRFGGDCRPCPLISLGKPRGPAVIVATAKPGASIRGAGFGGMSHHPPYESPAEAGSAPITGQPLNSFQDSLPFRSPSAFLSFSRNTRWIWPLLELCPGP